MTPFKPEKIILRRTAVLMGALGILLFCPLIWRLYDVSVRQHDDLEKQAIDQQTRAYPVDAARGTIYDRNHNPLAVSGDVHDLCIAPNKIKEELRDPIADALVSLFPDRLKKEDLLEKMKQTGKANVKLLKKLEKDDTAKVLSLINGEITGTKYKLQVFLEPSTKRYYPNNNAASMVIGFVGDENKGLMGLEAGENETLTGTPGYTISARDNRGNPMPQQHEVYYEAKDGESLVLTIDETIQLFVDKNLESAVIENEVAERGCAIVMDVKTGGILAMSTKGDFDLNKPLDIADEEIKKELEQLKTTDKEAYNEKLAAERQLQWRNKAVNDTYEPGSTFKVFTAAMALEEKAVDVENDRFNCSGSILVEGWNKPINCHKHSGHGTQTFMESLLHSCNPAFIRIGQKVGPDNFYKYMEAFGFLNKTDIGLQGEAGSIISAFETYKKDLASQAVYSFGQTFKVTPIQLVTAMCSIANGGHLMKPYVVAATEDSEGHVTKQTQPTEVRQVISKETSDTMREYLEQCVIQGTGSNAYVKGYRVCGKTGTSQKRDVANAQDNGWYVVSFMGFAPADDPQIAVLVMLDTPGGPRNLRTGGYMAAPVAGGIFADALPYLGVQPQYTDEEAKTADVKMPFLKNKTVEDAKKELEAIGLKVKVEGKEKKIVDQIPLTGSVIPAGTEVLLYTEATRPDKVVKVPDVGNMTPEDANEALIGAGLLMRPRGAAERSDNILSAAHQDPAPETEVPTGKVIDVEFRSLNVADSADAG